MPCGDESCFVLEAVAAQTPRDERVVERPDGAGVVADGVVAALASCERAHAPPGEEPVAAEVAHDGLGLRLVDDAAPEEVAVVRRERVDLAAVGVEGDREVLAVVHPEVAVEASLEVGGFLLEPVGEGWIVPDEAGQARAAHLGVVGVALELAGGPREAGQRAVAIGDRVPGVFPALVLEAGVLVAPLVGDVAVALEVCVLVDPVAAPRVPRTRARAPAWCRRSIARTRRAAPRTAGWRRRCRSTASGVAPRTRSSRRSASRGGSGPDPRRGSRRCECPGAARARAASSRRAPG